MSPQLFVHEFFVRFVFAHDVHGVDANEYPWVFVRSLLVLRARVSAFAKDFTRVKSGFYHRSRHEECVYAARRGVVAVFYVVLYGRVRFVGGPGFRYGVLFTEGLPYCVQVYVAFCNGP